VSVVYGWISTEHGMILTRENWSTGIRMEHWWNDTDRGQPKYPETNLAQCYFLQYKSHMDWQGIEPGTPWWQVVTMVWPCVMWRGSKFCLHTVSRKRNLSQMWYCSLVGRYTLSTRLLSHPRWPRP
jgi:hypothetical protein